MSTASPRARFGAVVALQAALLFSLLGLNVVRSMLGTTVTLRVVPNTVAVFAEAGQPVPVRLEISNLQSSSSRDMTLQGTVYVPLRQQGDVWVAGTPSVQRPEYGVFLVGEAGEALPNGSTRSSTVSVTYGLEEYRVSQSAPDNPLPARTQGITAKVHVRGDGRASLKQLYVQGKRWPQERLPEPVMAPAPVWQREPDVLPPVTAPAEPPKDEPVVINPPEVIPTEPSRPAPPAETDGKDIAVLDATEPETPRADGMKETCVTAEKTTKIQGAIDKDEVWGPACGTIMLDSAVIGADAKVTVKPGTVIKMANEATLLVMGAFDVLGTAANRIHVTSRADQSVGIDGSGIGAQIRNQNWGTIQVAEGGKLRLFHAVIRFGGVKGALIEQKGGEVTVTRSFLVESSGKAVNQIDGILTMDLTEVAWTRNGLFSSQGSMRVTRSSFHDNTNGSLNSFSSATVDARRNWWGDRSGPKVGTNSNPDGPNDGYGDSVMGSGYYRPWLAASPVQVDAFHVPRGNVLPNTVCAKERTATALPADINGVTMTPKSGVLLVTGATVIRANAKLLLAPCTVLKFSAGSSMLVEGEVTANGREDSPVFVTSTADDAGNDSNNDGTATKPKRGDWAGITFAPKSRGTFAYTRFSYGAGGPAEVMLENGGGTLTFSNSGFMHADAAFAQFDGATVFSATGFEDLVSGIVVSGGALEVHASSFVRVAGVALDNRGTSPIDATGNWWGVPSLKSKPSVVSGPVNTSASLGSAPTITVMKEQKPKADVVPPPALNVRPTPVTDGLDMGSSADTAPAGVAPPRATGSDFGEPAWGKTLGGGSVLRYLGLAIVGFLVLALGALVMRRRRGSG